jgi:hypothetical protein
MSAVSVLKGIHNQFKNNVQNKYSYKVDVVFNNVVPQQRIREIRDNCGVTDYLKIKLAISCNK